MPGEHRGEFAIRVGVASMRERGGMESRSDGRERRGIALRRDDGATARDFLSAGRIVSHRAGRIERELLLGGESICQRRRSEERRVGKECRSRWSRDHEKKKKRMSQ